MTTLFISHSSKDKAWAERVYAALKTDYHGVFLDSHPDDGIHAGAEWEQELYQKLRQSRGVVVLCSANWLASPWCVAEAMMARERKRSVFLVATADIADGRQVKRPDGTDVPQIPDFLKDKQFISLSDDDDSEEEAFRRLLDGLEKEGLNKKNFILPDRPYPGLEPFTQDDGAIFFGRDEEIDLVIDVLHRRRKGDAKGFILVLGASGCGKSSLVRAGVLPRLENAGKSDGNAWVVVPPFTGGQGLEGLAESLETAFRDAGEPRDADDIREGRASAKTLRSLCSKLRGTCNATEGRVVIVLDQLEEVFGTPEGSEARAALQLLLDASEKTFSPLVILATMRSDFLNAFQLFEGAAKRYEEITLDPMLRSRFSEVIEGPAERFGIDLDPGLAERMVEDAEFADALPLLAHTLERLYDEYGADEKLEMVEYEKLFPPVAVHGSNIKVRGVSAAIKITADEILEETGYAKHGKPLPDDVPRMRDLRRAFYSLAQVGEEGGFTRRTARWSQMPASCKEVLQRFVKKRLLVSSGRKENTQGDKTEPILSVGHEALFRVWDTLNGWLRKDRKALALRTQIEEAAAEWDGAHRAESRAWSEERVMDALRDIGRSGVSLADVKGRATIDAFLGPNDPKEIVEMLSFMENRDDSKGSVRYGDVWQLPLSHEGRASAGVRLSLLGDPRPGVGLGEDGSPEIDWRSVDGGDVYIRVAQHGGKHVAPFQISRYPITVAQYRAFLEAEDGWRNAEWWAEDLYRDPEGDSYHFGRFGNHPTIFVSWFDAMAFCRWLSRRLDMKIVLPTEFQWQIAAIGGDPKRDFPWSDPKAPFWNPQEEPWRANTLESNLGCPTAVGMYPAGESPAGVSDMAGTIYEWCRNAFDEPYNSDVPTSSEGIRAMRGGSCGSSRGNSRSTIRHWFDPYDRDDDIGFRVVCLTPSPDIDP